MAIWGCGSPARCCQHAVVGGLIYADLRSELNTHLAPQALFTQSSPGLYATATSFSLSKHTGEGDIAPAFSGLPVNLQLMWEVVFPRLLWSFPPTATFISFPAPDCWACATTSAFSSWLVSHFSFLILQCSGHPTLFAMCLFCCYCLLFIFSFFPWVGVGLSRGLCWFDPGLTEGVPHAA
jgi:hypothetical protein